MERYGPSCRYHDQTVLNHLLRGHWLELPEHWNCLSKCLSWSQSCGFGPDPLPAVLHYYAVVKPWISAIEPWPTHRLWSRFGLRSAGRKPVNPRKQVGVGQHFQQ
ncbi:MAG: glycosyltransferase, partial [bacterium]